MPKIAEVIYMSNLKRVGIADMKVGKWLWVEFDTAFNGEGGVSCPAKVTSVDNEKASLVIFGNDFGIGGAHRGQKAEILLKDIEQGKAGIFIPNPKRMAAHVAEETKWINSQKKFLDGYEKELSSAR